MCLVDWADEHYYPYTQATCRARNSYRCDECGRQIAPGERYERFTGKIDEGWDLWRTCAHCLWARDWLMGQCGGFLFSAVKDDLEEHWQEEHLLRSLDLGRRIIGMRRRWQRADGSLMEVPA